MANVLDAYVPQLWANESLMILEDNIVAAGLVYRDFENAVADYGDTVNTRSRSAFSTKRKVFTDSVTDQDAVATNVAVKLDQHAHVSFMIHDADNSKSFKDLTVEYIEPAMKAMAKFLDQIVLGQYPQFLANMSPGLGLGTSSTIKDYVLNTRLIMNRNKVPEGGRNLIWTPNAETAALKVDAFTQSQIIADGGLAMREAALGRKFAYNNYMSQLMGSVATGNTDRLTGMLVNNASGIAVGATTIAVDTYTAAVANNSFVLCPSTGDVFRVVSSTGGTAPSAITIASPGVRAAIANDAALTIMDPGAVNEASGYAQYWSKPITYDGFTNAPVAGQMVSFGTSASNAIYTIVEATSTTILLDRPLEAAIADDDAINVGPNGEYNLAFHRDAIALVVRPLRLVPSDMGVRSAVVNSPSASMRVTMAYDSAKQGIRVTLDMLCGVKVLNANLGCIMGA